MLKPKKFLGQNFLRDENILRKIVDNLNLGDNDTVVEIGCGNGSLTKHLIASGARIFGIEIDERSVKLLKESFNDKMTIIHSDVLDVSLMEISKQQQTKLKVAGNIPYYLTTEIIFWLFDAMTAVTDATLMMQLEVARRLVAKPRKKEYGILSVFSQFYSDCEILFKVSRNCFFPKPDVDSAVVRLKFKEELPECDTRLFRSVVRSTFGKRRKTLRNSLKSLGYDDISIEKIKFDLAQRPEELSVEKFVLLTNLLSGVK